jgi:hypothetical protein
MFGQDQADSASCAEDGPTAVGATGTDLGSGRPTQSFPIARAVTKSGDVIDAPACDHSLLLTHPQFH